MNLEEQAETIESQAPESAAAEPQERDYEAEARALGWRPPEEFPGDPKKMLDAKTFVERGETMLPLIRKERDHWKEQFQELKREVKRASKHFAAAEERAYQRALSDLEQRHDEAVESGDVAASKRIRKEMENLKPQPEPDGAPENQPDTTEFQQRIRDWIDQSDWYFVDEKKTKYADLQSDQIIREYGALHTFPGGLDEALTEIDRRVARKFAEKKPSPTNGGGNREGASKGGRTLNDLPPAARAQALKWDKQGIVKVDDYLKTYEWD